MCLGAACQASISAASLSPVQGSGLSPEATACSGMEGTTVDKAQVALGKVLLGGERMCNATPLGLAPLPETETISLWDWSPYPDKAFSGALAKAQVMPVPGSRRCWMCQCTGQGFSTHTLILPRVRASFPGRHPSLILTHLAVENCCVQCFSGHLPCTHTLGCLAQPLLPSSSPWHLFQKPLCQAV